MADGDGSPTWWYNYPKCVATLKTQYTVLKWGTYGQTALVRADDSIPAEKTKRRRKKPCLPSFSKATTPLGIVKTHAQDELFCKLVLHVPVESPSKHYSDVVLNGVRLHKGRLMECSGQNEHELMCAAWNAAPECFPEPVSCIEVTENDDRYMWIVMHKYHNDLLGFVSSNDIRADDLFFLAWQLVNCVYELHRIGIAHLDIKLDNFLITAKRGVLLADMGHAVRVLPTSPVFSDDPPYKLDFGATNDAELTVFLRKSRVLLNRVCGSPWYRAHEQHVGVAFNPFAVDVFQLAQTIHAMFHSHHTGRDSDYEDDGTPLFLTPRLECFDTTDPHVDQLVALLGCMLDRNFRHRPTILDVVADSTFDEYRFRDSTNSLNVLRAGDEGSSSGVGLGNI